MSTFTAKVILPDSSHLTISSPQDTSVRTLKGKITQKLELSGKSSLVRSAENYRLGLDGALLDDDAELMSDPFTEDYMRAFKTGDVLEFAARLKERLDSKADDDQWKKASAATLIASGVSKEGTLTKQGQSYKSWNSRLFVLKNNKIYYFKNKDAAEPLGAIDIFMDTHVELLRKEDMPPNAFSLSRKDEREWFLAASTTQETTDWIKEIRLTIVRELKFFTSLAVDFLQERALSLEGIFRISGAKSVISDLKTKGETEGWSLDPSLDPHAVAGLLKLYLREVQDPLIPYSHYSKIVTLAGEDDLDDKLDGLRAALASVGKQNRSLVRFLLEFLNEVQKYSDQNKMTSTNLAVVFAPNILRSTNLEDAIRDSRQVNEIFATMITHVGRIFEYKPSSGPPPPPLRSASVVGPPPMLSESSGPAPPLLSATSPVPPPLLSRSASTSGSSLASLQLNSGLRSLPEDDAGEDWKAKYEEEAAKNAQLLQEIQNLKFGFGREKQDKEVAQAALRKLKGTLREWLQSGVNPLKQALDEAEI